MTSRACRTLPYGVSDCNIAFSSLAALLNAAYSDVDPADLDMADAMCLRTQVGRASSSATAARNGSKDMMATRLKSNRAKPCCWDAGRSLAISVGVGFRIAAVLRSSKMAKE